MMSALLIRTLRSGWSAISRAATVSMLAGFGDIEFDRLHTGVGGDDLVEIGTAAAGNDDLVAARMKGLGKRSPNARSTAGDKNSVAREFHDDLLLPSDEAVISRGSGRRTSASR
jgi:hypothetical protein